MVKKYVTLLDLADAGGLIIALRAGQTFPQEIVDYCNDLEFPLFSATWRTSYMEMIHMVSSILLKNEHKEARQITALKNAIHNPKDTESYAAYFEETEFLKGQGNFITILGFEPYDAKNDREEIKKMEKTLRYAISDSIIYEENGTLVIFASNHWKNEIKQWFQEMCGKNDCLCAGMGTMARCPNHIRHSYETADIAYQLSKAGIGKILDYDGLGIYKLLSDIRKPDIYPAFVEETLGPLLRYDRENQTDYVQILETYFENECSGRQTSEVLYFHKNTMTSKLNKIRDVLGYDILKNENRTRIMIAFSILRMGTEYFKKPEK